MRLFQISNNNNWLLNGWLALCSESLTEDKASPWWPAKWAEDVINSPKFAEWLNGLGVVGSVGKSMAGGVGRAYFVGDKHVVKFTTDRNEASAAAILKDHDSLHAAQVYDVKRVLTIDDPRSSNKKLNLFAIVMEKLNTGVGKRMRIAGNAVYSYLDNNPSFIEDPEAVVDVVMSNFIPDRHNNEQMRTIVTQVVNALHDVQNKTGVLMQDPHGGNMALKGRNPAFFDFGRSSTNYDHPKSAGARITGL